MYEEHVAQQNRLVAFNIYEQLWLYCVQNTTDFMSMNEALLIRFRTDDTIANKGFVAIFVAVDRQESEENLDGEDNEDSKNL